MNSRSFQQKFTIHPVGQGFFYSGTIKCNDRVVFRMVFDCGSKTKGAGQEEVDEYRKDPDFIKENKLDLLVISHFDADHVNHIGKLLQGGVKINRLVMPFVNFEERLFLTLKHLQENGGYNSSIEYSLRLILEPFATLQENIEDSFEGYLIQSDPDNPISPENIFTDSNSQADEERTPFIFSKKEKAKSDSKGGFNIPDRNKDNVFEVKDSTKGITTDFSRRFQLMDFLFYRKSIGAKEEEFYSTVKNIFFQTQNIDPTLDDEKLLVAIQERLKAISSATQIVKIFKKAAKEVGIPLSKVSNLNTTALCMLHKNLNDIRIYLTGGAFNPEDYYRPHEYKSIFNIQKFLSGNSSRVIKKDFRSYYHDDLFYEIHNSIVSDFIMFPNTLLTSDAFLLSEEDVIDFLQKFRNYFNEFWLFQVPHHGSKENSDAKLHSNIPFNSYCFINYGTRNKDKHPSEIVIHSLVTTGLSTKLIPVNEYQGFLFEYTLNLTKKN